MALAVAILHQGSSDSHLSFEIHFKGMWKDSSIDPHLSCASIPSDLCQVISVALWSPVKLRLLKIPAHCRQPGVDENRTIIPAT